MHRHVDARGGHLELLKYLHDNGCLWNVLACKGAARGGHLEVLKYLHDNGCLWDKDRYCYAAVGGHLEVVKYLDSNGCLWDKFAYCCAVYGGHLEVVKYLGSNGCPWDNFAYCCAVYGGYLEVLKYLDSNGFPWDKKRIIDIIIKNNRVDVMEWLLEEKIEELSDEEYGKLMRKTNKNEKNLKCPVCFNKYSTESPITVYPCRHHSCEGCLGKMRGDKKTYVCHSCRKRHIKSENLF
jgi:hypothetical protein